MMGTLTSHTLNKSTFLFGFMNVSHMTYSDALRMMMNNLTYANGNAEEYDFMHASHWQGLIITLYIAVILVGIIGNGTVIYIVIRNRHMQNVTNILIGTLAASDVALSAFCMPIQLHYTITKKWVFGATLCRMIFAAFAIPMYVSTWTILLIAVDRYRLIVCPLQERISKRTALLLVLAMVCMAICLSIPVICFTVLSVIDEPIFQVHRQHCLEAWPDLMARKVYSVFTFTFQFCLPLTITALLYLRIMRKLRTRTSSNRRNTERKERTNKILISIVTLFVICWLPFNLFSLVTEMDKELVTGAHFSFTDLLLKFVALSSACANPFLYCWLNENFRKELDNIAISLNVYKPPANGSNQKKQRGVPPQPIIQVQDHEQYTSADQCNRTFSTTNARDMLLTKSGTFNNNLHVSTSASFMSGVEAISSCGNTVVIETSYIDLQQESTSI